MLVAKRARIGCDNIARDRHGGFELSLIKERCHQVVSGDERVLVV